MGMSLALRLRTCLLSSCVLACCTAHAGETSATPAGCTGVPGDFRTPSGGDLAPPATHGPAGTGSPHEVVASSKPLTADTIPALYVYGPRGEYVLLGSDHATPLTDPAFNEAQ